MDPERFRGWDERLRQATAKIPTLVLWGDADPFIASSMADRFGGKVHRHADAGHWLMLDKPAEVASAIATHLDPQPREVNASAPHRAGSKPD